MSRHDHLAYNRLTHVQLLLARKPAPLQSSTVCPRKYSRTLIEYLLLQPRSVPVGAPPKLTLRFRSNPPHPLTHGRTVAHAQQRGALRCRLRRHPFSERLASAGELLHIPWRIPTFMATDLLSIASSILYGF